MRLKKSLENEFEVKDLGSLRYFLGMEVARSKNGITVSQRKYTLDLLKETGMLGARPAETPMEPACKLDEQNNDKEEKDSVPVDADRYKRLVGKLLYLSHTRPDICYAVGVVSRFTNKPLKEHMDAVYRILHYLKMTPGRGIYFEKGKSRELVVYTDADHAGFLPDRRSTSGYCTMLWGNVVTWRSKKQTVVSRSSAEAELRAIAHGVCEGLWIIRILKELGLALKTPIRLRSDSMSAIAMVRNPIHHERTKHVDIDKHFIKEKEEEGILELIHVPSRLQVGDLFTKALARPQFEELRCKLGMKDIYLPA